MLTKIKQLNDTPSPVRRITSCLRSQSRPPLLVDGKSIVGTASSYDLNSTEPTFNPPIFHKSFHNPIEIFTTRIINQNDLAIARRGLTTSARRTRGLLQHNGVQHHTTDPKLTSTNTHLTILIDKH